MNGFALSSILSVFTVGSLSAPNDGGAALEPSEALPKADGGMVTFPRLVTDVRPQWPAELPAGVDGGVVTLRLTVDEAGQVIESAVETATDPAFARAALDASVRLVFSPAQVDGQPRAAIVSFTYHFEAPAEAAPAAPDTVRLSGVVLERGNRRPIPLARLQTDSGLSCETDSEGRFVLEVPGEPPLVHLLVQAVGFRAESVAESVAGASAIQVTYRLTPTQTGHFETVVRAEAHRTETSRVELRGSEVREVPGTLGDPFRVVMLLPGVATPMSGVAFPVVRGSSPGATATFLDGIRVPQLFHAFLGPAVIHPDFIDGVDFFSGGASARYGRFLGGVVEGRIGESSERELRATASVDLLNAGGLVRAPIEATGTKVALAGRLSYSAPLLGLISPLIAGPDGPRITAGSWDYQGRIDQPVLGGKVRVFAFGSGDAFGLTYADPLRDGTTHTITFHRADLRYRHELGPGRVETGLTVGSDAFGYDSKGPDFVPETDVVIGSRQVSTRIEQASLATRASWDAQLSAQVRLSTGVTWEHVRAGYAQTRVHTPFGAPSVTLKAEAPLAIANIFGGWAEATFSPSERFAVTAGVRADHFRLVPQVSQTSAEPRVSASYQLSERVTLRGAIGQYHQPPTFLVSLPVVDVAGLRHGLQDVIHSSIGVTVRAWNNLELSGDAYLHSLLRTLELGVFDDERIDYDNPLDDNSGDPGGFVPPGGTARAGLAYGLDLMARWPMSERWFGWATLSLQRSTRTTQFRTYDDSGRRTGTASGDLPYAFDQTVVANAALSYRFDNGLSVGASVHFNTGRPESGELGSRTRVRGVDERGRPAWIRVSRDRVDLLPPFLRVDLRVAKTWVFDVLTVEAWLDVLNASVSAEILGYSYTLDPDGRMVKLPTALPVVLPSLGVKARY